MIQYGVAVLEKDLSFPADCALSWIIWIALNLSIQPYWTTSVVDDFCRRPILIPARLGNVFPNLFLEHHCKDEEHD